MRTKNERYSKKTHILEYDIFGVGNSTEYIDRVYKHVKQILSSPECALLYRDLYNKEYNTTYSTDKENVLGSVLVRDSEKVDDYVNTEHLIKAYIHYDIGKFFNMSITEYLDTTKYFKELLNKAAINRMKEISEELEKLNKENEDNTGEIENGIYNQ